MVLIKHGIFSFKTAEESYLRMIELVTIRLKKVLPRKIQLDLYSPRKYDSNMKNLDEFIPLRGLISKKFQNTLIRKDAFLILDQVKI